MPNIVIIGRSSRDICDEITKIVTQLGVDPKEGVITYSPEICCISMMPDNHDCPYIIVRDSDKERALEIGDALRHYLGMDVEVEVLAAFFSKS